jgi:hypothetical protein
LAKIVRVIHWTEKGRWQTDYYETVSIAMGVAGSFPSEAKAYVVEIVSREEARNGIKIICVGGKTAQTRKDLTEVYNDVVDEPVKGFKDHPTAVRRTEAALAAKFPTEEDELEDSTVEEFEEKQDANEGDEVSAIEVGTEKPKRRGRAAAGVEPKGADTLKKIRQGTVRAQILARMTGDSTAGDIAAELGVDSAKVLAHAYCLARDVGIGYGFDEEGRIFARFPEGKSLTDVLIAA